PKCASTWLNGAVIGEPAAMPISRRPFCSVTLEPGSETTCHRLASRSEPEKSSASGADGRVETVDSLPSATEIVRRRQFPPPAGIDANSSFAPAAVHDGQYSTRSG